MPVVGSAANDAPVFGSDAYSPPNASEAYTTPVWVRRNRRPRGGIGRVHATDASLAYTTPVVGSASVARPGFWISGIGDAGGWICGSLHFVLLRCRILSDLGRRSLRGNRNVNFWV